MMEKVSPMTRVLSDVIPFGRNNAIMRHVLASRLGMSDRGMRRAIQTARDEGLIILNAQDGRGYYQSAEIQDMVAQYHQDTARAMAILKRRKTLRTTLINAGVDIT